MHLVPVDINPYLSHPSLRIVGGIFKISSLTSLIFYGLPSSVRVCVQVCVIPVVAAAPSPKATRRAQLDVP